LRIETVQIPEDQLLDKRLDSDSSEKVAEESQTQGHQRQSGFDLQEHEKHEWTIETGRIPEDQLLDKRLDSDSSEKAAEESQTRDHRKRLKTGHQVHGAHE